VRYFAFTKQLLTLSVISLLITLFANPVVATETPFLKMHSDIFENTSRPQFLDRLTVENPLYIFSTPFRDNNILTPQKIQEIHDQLPQTKVILHLLCCTLFDNKEVDSIPPGKIQADLQNTQAEFDNTLSNHRNIFMKNSTGGYVYYKIEKNGNYWFYEGDGYLADPGNTIYQEHLYNKIKHHVISSGYDGIYLDLMYPNFMQAFYYSKPFINGHEITRNEWNNKLISLSRYLQDRRQNDPDPKMKNALIITNSVGGGPGDSLDPIDRIQFNRDLQTQGVQIENPFQNYQTTSTTAWLDTVNRIKDISSLRNNSLGGWINYHQGEITYPDQEACDDHGLFAYSSYLLANQSPNFAFAFDCKMGAGDRQEPSQNLTHVRLGSALAPYQKLSSGLYVCRFDHGFVLVNPTSGSLTYQPNLNLKNAYSSTSYPKNTNITLPAKTGMVLLKEATSFSSDFNSDGTVNLLDYNLLKAGFGTTYNLLNYNTLRSQWGQ